VEIPEGSSSAAPVIRPGPKPLKNPRELRGSTPDFCLRAGLFAIRDLFRGGVGLGVGTGMITVFIRV